MQQGKEHAMQLEGVVATAGITIYSVAILGVLRIMISVGCSAQFYWLQVSYCYARDYVFWPSLAAQKCFNHLFMNTCMFMLLTENIAVKLGVSAVHVLVSLSVLLFKVWGYGGRAATEDASDGTVI